MKRIPTERAALEIALDNLRKGLPRENALRDAGVPASEVVGIMRKAEAIFVNEPIRMIAATRRKEAVNE